MYDTYKDIQWKLPECREIHGNSVTAMRNTKTYDIYSYSTLMARVNLETRKLEYYNDTKYSRTTSRLQHLIRLSFN